MTTTSSGGQLKIVSPADYLWRVNAEIRDTPTGWAQAAWLMNIASGNSGANKGRDMPSITARTPFEHGGPLPDFYEDYRAAMDKHEAASLADGTYTLCKGFDDYGQHGVPLDFMADDDYCLNCLQLHDRDQWLEAIEAREIRRDAPSTES